MARFLKLTNAFGSNEGAPVVINLDHIVSIIPFNKEDSAYQDNAPKAQTLIYTSGQLLYHVQETFEKITGSLPN